MAHIDTMNEHDHFSTIGNEYRNNDEQSLTKVVDITFDLDDSDDSDDSDTSHESTISSSNKASQIAVVSEGLQRRQTFLMVISIVPFILSCAALGMIIITGKNKKGTYSGKSTAAAAAAAVTGDGALVLDSDATNGNVVGEYSTISPSIPPVEIPAPTASIASVVVTPSPTYLRVTPVPTYSRASTDSPTTLSPTPSSMTPVPTSMGPTSPPTMTLVDIGNDGVPIDDYPLGECQGDCDDDSECQGPLVCFLRNNRQSVPGCASITGTPGTDYCISLENLHANYTFVSTSSSGSYEVCTGDCDKDSDCAMHLVCQKNNGLDEFGCLGSQMVDFDYCVSPEVVLSGDGYAPVTTKPAAKEPATGAPVSAAPVAPIITTPPTIQPVQKQPTCTGANLSCEDKNTVCCSGTCTKDKDTKQKLCAAPVVCAMTAASCEDKNAVCCSGVCKKDKDTKEKLCAAPVVCAMTAASCEDKNAVCCSGVCKKDKDTKEKLCG